MLKKIVRFLFQKLTNFYDTLLNSVYYFPYKDAIIINAWVKVKKGKLVYRNWGDDINVLLLEMITGKKVIVRNQSLFHKIFNQKNYICIGSVLGMYENSKALIWGTGAISENLKLKVKDVQICSVRGKKTQKLLQVENIDCPSSYGDPALLVSRYYRPKVNKKYRLGIIPHYVDLNNEFVLSFLRQHQDCILINLANYNNWLDILDQVNSCELIISSSLHGLIISDSYSIPNIWVKFSDNIIGGSFKYLDYFSSVGRIDLAPKKIKSVDDIENLLVKNRAIENNINIDYQSILQSCPFKTRPPKYTKK